MNWKALTPDKLEQALVGAVSRLATWAAPFPTAYLVYEKTQVHLGWPWWVAFILALALEALGLTAAVAVFRAKQFNAIKYKAEEPARVLLPAALMGVYVILVLAMTVLLDVATLPAEDIKAANLMPVVLPFLSVVAVILMAERTAVSVKFAEHWETVRKNRQDRLDRAAKSDTSGQDVGQNDRQDDSEWTGFDTVSDNGRTQILWPTKEAFMSDADRPVDIEPKELAVLIGKTERTAYRWLEEAAADG